MKDIFTLKNTQYYSLKRENKQTVLKALGQSFVTKVSVAEVNWTMSVDIRSQGRERQAERIRGNVVSLGQH